MSPISNVTVQRVERDLRLFERVDQISLRNLIQGGWTIEQLCDLIIDRDPGLDLQRQEILEFEVLRTEWLFARRVERQNQRVLVRLDEILAILEKGLQAGTGGAATLPASAGPAVGASPSVSSSGGRTGAPGAPTAPGGLRGKKS